MASVTTANAQEAICSMSCPKCEEQFVSTELFFDLEDNTEYAKLKSDKIKLENENKTLLNDLNRLEEAKYVVVIEGKRLQEEVKKLESENKKLEMEKQELAYDNERKLKDITKQNDGTMARNTQMEKENKDLVEKNNKLVNEIRLLKEFQERLKEKLALVIATEVSKRRKENTELRKRMITSDITVILLTNPDLLEETYGDLKWTDLTDTFQKELLRKLRIGGYSPLNSKEVNSMNSKALLGLIKAAARGNVSSDDPGNSFRQKQISKRRELSQMGSLQLSQVENMVNDLLKVALLVIGIISFLIVLIKLKYSFGYGH